MASLPCQALAEAQQHAEAAADEIADWLERKQAMEAERAELAAAVAVRRSASASGCIIST